MLGWLRRRMPVFWMTEGMIAGRRVDMSSEEPVDRGAKTLADLVSQHYRDLVNGTALNVPAAIEGGSAAARQLLARAKLVPGPTTPLGEVLEEITGKRKSPRSASSSELLEGYGTAAHKLGLLLLVGALLQSGVGRVEQGMDPLTLIENPEAHLHPMTLASIWSVIDRIRGQKIIATHSGTLLARARLSSLRRLTRADGLVKQWSVPDGTLSGDELRRYSYHLRSRRAATSFARCWLLVEGETEFWLMEELARVCGYEFASEGVTCVEFAQCGLGAVIKVAQSLGIEWHLLADGDAAGQHYVRSARELAGTAMVQDRFTLLHEQDLEHCFWKYGYDEVFRKAAYPPTSSVVAPVQRRAPAKAVIARAIERYSKPYLAVLLLDAVIDRGPRGVPAPLRRAIESCVQLARQGLVKR
jgi:putative ATP-dependent endonuclease of OLD family